MGDYYGQSREKSNYEHEDRIKKAKEDIEEIQAKQKLLYPIESFPNKIQTIVEELKVKLNFPTDFTASSILFAASVAIGNTYQLRYLWDVKPNLFMILVGKPGSNKSHPVDFALKPILNRDKLNFIKFEKEMDAYEQTVASSTKKTSQGIIPPKPILKKHIVSDASMEAVKASMKNNNRGIGLWSDEIAGWLNGFKKYNSSLEQWLSIWSGKEIIHERKNIRAFRVPDPFASVIGTIQSEIIEDIAKGNQLKNGFLDRILFVRPPDIERKAWQRLTSPLQSIELWKNILDKILLLDFADPEDSNSISNYIKFTPDAEQIIIDWQNQSIKKDKDEFGEVIDSISAKTEIHVLRIALILQILKWACSEGNLGSVDAESAKSAVALCNYFKSTAISIFEHVSTKNPFDRLTDLKQKIYGELNSSGPFHTSDGVLLASYYGMPERTFKYWLTTDDKLFKRAGHGIYNKLYKR